MAQRAARSSHRRSLTAYGWTRMGKHTGQPCQRGEAKGYGDEEATHCISFRGMVREKYGDETIIELLTTRWVNRAGRGGDC